MSVHPSSGAVREGMTSPSSTSRPGYSAFHRQNSVAVTHTSVKSIVVNLESNKTASTKPASDRLTRSQLLIERLQENLSTRLKPATVQTLRNSYSPTRGQSQAASKASPDSERTEDRAQGSRVDEENGDNSGDSSKDNDFCVVSTATDSFAAPIQREFRKEDKQEISVGGPPTLEPKVTLSLSQDSPKEETHIQNVTTQIRDTEELPVPAVQDSLGQESNPGLAATQSSHATGTPAPSSENSPKVETHEISETDSHTISNCKGTDAENNIIRPRDADDNQNTGDGNPASAVSQSRIANGTPESGEQREADIKAEDNSKASSSETPRKYPHVEEESLKETRSPSQVLAGDDNSSKSESVTESHNTTADTPQEVTKTHRVPWTTRLIEKLSEEENRKKDKKDEQVASPARQSRRLVRYPGQKDFVPNHIPAIAKKQVPPPPVSPPVPKPVKPSPKPSTVDAKSLTGSDSSKDGYAELINELVTSPDDSVFGSEPAEETSKFVYVDDCGDTITNSTYSPCSSSSNRSLSTFSPGSSSVVSSGVYSPDISSGSIGRPNVTHEPPLTNISATNCYSSPANSHLSPKGHPGPAGIRGRPLIGYVRADYGRTNSPVNPKNIRNIGSPDPRRVTDSNSPVSSANLLMERALNHSYHLASPARRTVTDPRNPNVIYYSTPDPARTSSPINLRPKTYVNSNPANNNNNNNKNIYINVVPGNLSNVLGASNNNNHHSQIIYSNFNPTRAGSPRNPNMYTNIDPKRMKSVVSPTPDSSVTVPDSASAAGHYKGAQAEASKRTVNAMDKRPLSPDSSYSSTSINQYSTVDPRRTKSPINPRVPNRAVSPGNFQGPIISPNNKGVAVSPPDRSTGVYGTITPKRATPISPNSSGTYSSDSPVSPISPKSNTNVNGRSVGGLRRLLSPWSSSRREEEHRPILGDARVFPAQQKPIVETAFLCDSPSKQNNYNLSRSQVRSKSVSPSRKNVRSVPDTSLILEERLHHMRREQSPHTVQAGSPYGQQQQHHQQQQQPPEEYCNYYVGRRNDVRYQSLPPTSRGRAGPQQPVYQNVHTRYAPISVDLERHAISGSPDIRQQLQQHKTQQQQHPPSNPLLMTAREATYMSSMMVRGVPQRGTLACNTVQLRQKPIFKRGSLVSVAPMTPPVDHGVPKRVSFTGSEPSAWPTRNGPAPQPPTRQHAEAPHRPLPPLPHHHYQSESESGSEAGEVQRILRHGTGHSQTWRYSDCLPPTMLIRWKKDKSSSGGSSSANNKSSTKKKRKFGREEEEWNADGKARGAPGSEHSAPSGGRDEEVRRGGGGGGGARAGRRDEPRRHTLSGDHHHQHQAGSLARSMDLEMSSKSQRRKSPLPRAYPPPSTAMLFDEDPGIMSEVETSSTGFRRGGKQRSSLPVVRTPSKTLERPLGKTSGVLRIATPQGHPGVLLQHHPSSKSAATGSGGLVFLQYRNETKRALLPNEITSIDTVKALFVRSFPKQLTMEYLDSPHVKIYIHDSSKDMFYELEDLRSHLRDIRDRSVLRLFESADMNGGVLPGAGVGVVAPSMWDQDQSYFSEPEFDSEYQHQHIHKTKASSKASSGVSPQPYYMTHSYPPGGSQPSGAPATLPRGGPLLRAYSPAVVPPVPAERIKSLPQTGVQPPPKPVRTYQQVKGPSNVGPRVPERIYGSFISPPNGRTANLYSSPDRLHSESGYMSSPERGGPRAYPAPYPAGGQGYEDPYYSQYASRSGSITPVIDEEASDTELMDESYSLYGVKLPTGRPVAPQPRSQFPTPAVVPYDATRIRVEHMERQLANLTGLVQKALTQTPTSREYLQVPTATRDSNYRNAVDEYDKHSSSSSASLPDDSYLRTDTKPPKLGKDKSVSFEKSVSFSDEPPDMNSPKQHSPQHTADSKPTKPAIKSSTLPRMSSQERTERDRHKPAPPPKPVSLSPGQYEGRHVYRDLHLTPEMYNQLRGLQKKAKDLRQEVRNLRRMSQAQAHTVRETIRDTFIKIRAVLMLGGDEAWTSGGDADKMRLSREEDAYKQEMLRLEKDLTELESTVEELRGNVINRKTRVNMSDVENMALILSKSSKTVADLKVRFPSLQEGMKSLLSSEMEKVVREEKFLKEEPERLESALRRCKKLTGTLVTLKRLASVQEQRLPPTTGTDARLSPTLGTDSDPPITPPAHGKTSTVPARSVLAPSIGSGSDVSLSRQRPENALDALLDELQTFARPPSNPSHNPPMSEIGRKGSIDSAHPPTGPSSTIPGATSSLRRLHSYPSSSDGGGNSPPTVPLSRLQVSGPTDPPKSPATSPKPPVPERNSELLSHLAGRRVPPPPPPRTSSRSPLASPTSPSLPPRGQHPPNQPQMGVGGGTLLRRGGPGRSSLREPLRGSSGISLPPEPKPSAEETSNAPGTFNPLSASNSSSCESVNSQEGLQNKSGNKARQEILEQRHQELLRKQRALQEQYARLQQLQRGGGGGLTVIPPPDLLLKKTGSESNLLAKMGLGHGLTAAAPISGSLTHLAAVAAANQPIVPPSGPQQKAETATTSTSTATTATAATTTTTTTTNKIYETDIL